MPIELPSKLCPILAIFPETATTINHDDIIPFPNITCKENTALYLLIGS
jgi:hypothetical protein